jgi:hypothetical protein
MPSLRNLGARACVQSKPTAECITGRERLERRNLLNLERPLCFCFEGGLLIRIVRVLNYSRGCTSGMEKNRANELTWSRLLGATQSLGVLLDEQSYLLNLLKPASDHLRGVESLIL